MTAQEIRTPGKYTLTWTGPQSYCLVEIVDNGGLCVKGGMFNKKRRYYPLDDYPDDADFTSGWDDVSKDVARDTHRKKIIDHLARVRPKNWTSTAQLGRGDSDKVGAVGEYEFHIKYGYPLNMTARPDDGIDFITPLGTVDCKTARKAPYLIVPQGKVVADYYLLYELVDEYHARFVGWARNIEVIKAPIRTMRGQSIENHTIPRHLLRTVDKWDAMLKEAETNEQQ